MLKKILLAPDSFKGTMSAVRVCEIMERAVCAQLPHCRIEKIPIADGGEGTVEAFLCAAGGKRVPVTVCGPNGTRTEAFYGLLPDGTAVVEMAAAAGLPLAGPRPDPERATTYGVGELIAHALGQGCRRVVLGLGGSATNDGGCGAAAALGVRFYDGAGQVFVPVGGTLRDIVRVDCAGVVPALRSTALTAMCDVENPLCGPEGAAWVFAPQKGADEAAVRRLDTGLRHLAEVLRRCLGADIGALPGAGAAGGMGGGMAAFFVCALQSGIETVLDVSGFDARLAGASLVLTGEGRIDAQSARGKAISGVAAHAGRAGVPVAAVVGDIGSGAEALYQQGLSGIFSINRVAVPYGEARLRAEEDLFNTVENLLRFLRVMEP